MTAGTRRGPYFVVPEKACSPRSAILDLVSCDARCLFLAGRRGVLRVTSFHQVFKLPARRGMSLSLGPFVPNLPFAVSLGILGIQELLSPILLELPPVPSGRIAQRRSWRVPLVARTIATISALMASDTSGQARATALRSGSFCRNSGKHSAKTRRVLFVSPCVYEAWSVVDGRLKTPCPFSTCGFETRLVQCAVILSVVTIAVQGAGLAAVLGATCQMGSRRLCRGRAKIRDSRSNAVGSESGRTQTSRAARETETLAFHAARWLCF